MKRRSAQKRLGALLTAEAATQAAASNEYIHIFIHALYGISAQGPTITLHGLLAWAVSRSIWIQMLARYGVV